MTEKKFLDKSGLEHYDKELKKKVVQATEIRKIEIVDGLPEIEEEGTLYLVVYTEPEPPIDKNLWDNPTVVEGWFNDDASYAMVELGNNTKYAYISCEPNTTYIITRTMDGYRFMVGTSTTEPNDGTTYFTNYQVASSLKSVEITSGANDHYLAIYYKGSSETLDETELLNDITVKVKQN